MILKIYSLDKNIYRFLKPVCKWHCLISVTKKYNIMETKRRKQNEQHKQKTINNDGGKSSISSSISDQ